MCSVHFKRSQIYSDIIEQLHIFVIRPFHDSFLAASRLSRLYLSFEIAFLASEALDAMFSFPEGFCYGLQMCSVRNSAINRNILQINSNVPLFCPLFVESNSVNSFLNQSRLMDDKCKYVPLIGSIRLSMQMIFSAAVSRIMGNQRAQLRSLSHSWSSRKRIKLRLRSLEKLFILTHTY